MSHRTAHIAKKLKGTATLLFLLFCVCSAVARDTTRVFSNLRWDNNGNLAQQTIYSVNNNVPTYQTMRMLFWDEDDRLNLVAGDGYLSYYAYGYDGNRAIKMTGNAAIDQTGTLLNSTNLENITIYPSEYMTVTQAEYTKYYYAGGNRIASKIGTGGFGKMQQLCTLDQNLTANANTLFDNVLQHAVNTTSQPTDEYPVDVCNGYNVATELLTEPLLDFYINSLNLNFTQNNLLQQFRQNLAGGTEAVYYFHSDHLGSASWITNNTGLPVQHLLYLPFGEHFANEHSSGYDERFTFTGKERDAETGYYYHGARFNSSDIGWLSVDPMADKYPSLTPYNYCAWNPIKLVDPEGMDVWEIDRKGNVTWKEKSEKTTVNAVNKKGERTSSVSLSNDNILKQLSNGRVWDRYDAAGSVTEQWTEREATSTNKKDIAKLFDFVSENTNVEWIVYSFKNKEDNSSKYGIGTYQSDSQSPGENRFKYRDKDLSSGWTVKSTIHCHARPRTQKDEVESLYGDKRAVLNCNYNYYTYMSNSKNLYKVNRNNTHRFLGKQNGYKSLLKYL